MHANFLLFADDLKVCMPVNSTFEAMLLPNDLERLSFCLMIGSLIFKNVVLWGLFLVEIAFNFLIVWIVMR